MYFRTRKSNFYLIFIAINLLFLSFLLLVHPAATRDDFEKKLAEERRIVRELGITDLCIFTEARYTRHLSQADLHSAFQDYPMAMEHFPSGSIVRPSTPIIVENNEVD
jgi:hypothetical protein